MAEIVRLTRSNQTALDQLNVLVRQLSPKATLMTRASLSVITKGKKCVELWVAQDEDEIIGMGTLAIYAAPTGLFARIEDVVVDEDHRGEGLGKGIMEKLIERAKFHNARHVDLTSRSNRMAANKLYKKLGFQVRDTNTNRLEL